MSPSSVSAYRRRLFFPERTLLQIQNVSIQPSWNCLKILMKLTKSMISWNGGIGQFGYVSKSSWTLTCHFRKIFPHHSAVQFAANQNSVLANIRAKRAVAKAAQGRGHIAAPHGRTSGTTRNVS
jgi:hypothetical protein